MGELLAFLFVAFCVYNFRKGYKNPQKSEILVDGDYFPIGKVISQPVPQRTRPKPVKKKPKKPKDPVILEDCIAAAKSLGFKAKKQQIIDFINNNSVKTVEEFILESTRKKM